MLFNCLKVSFINNSKQSNLCFFPLEFSLLKMVEQTREFAITAVKLAT